jgi:threonine 3-dehydrogenase
MFETWHKMIAMLQSGLNVRGVITHRFAARDYPEAFEIMAKGESGKIVLDWTAPLTPPLRALRGPAEVMRP